MEDLKNTKKDKLAQVNGGVDFAISELKAGDVLISNTNSCSGFVVTNDYPELDSDILIEIRLIIYNPGTNCWKLGGLSTKSPLSLLLNNYTYSSELSGTISY